MHRSRSPERVLLRSTLSRFKVEPAIARGGCASIHRATMKETGQVVALKILKHEYLSNEKVRRLFQREAWILTLLFGNPRIVQIIEDCTHEQSPYIVLELLDGVDMDERISIYDSPPHDGTAISVVIEVLRALRHIHQLGILHLDIKPANVFRCSNGTVRLLDFGISETVGDCFAGAPDDIRPDDWTGGTTLYAPPELMRGDRRGQFSDIFCVGMMLYELLIKVRPFSGYGSPQLIARRCSDARIQLAGYRNDLVDTPIGRVVEKALEKNPEKRYQSAIQMLHAIFRISHT